jgi:hypothetical protein
MIKTDETHVLVFASMSATTATYGYQGLLYFYLTKGANNTVTVPASIAIGGYSFGRIHTILGPNASGKCLIIFESHSAANGTTSLNIGTILAGVYTSQIIQLISAGTSVSEIALSPDNTKLYCYSPTLKGFYYTTLDLVNMIPAALTTIIPDVSLIPALSGVFSFPTSDSTYSHIVKTIYNMQFITNTNGTYLLLANGISSQSIGGTINGGYASYRVAIIKITTNTTLQVTDYEQLGPNSTDYTSMYYVVNSSNILGIRNGGLDMYTINSSNKLTLGNSVMEPVYSVGVDDCERVWYTTSASVLVTDSTLKIFNYSSMCNINITFAQTNMLYTGTVLSNTITINCTDLNNNLLAINVTLYIKGNATFANTGTQTINVTTSNTASITTNINIQGNGVINIIGSLT